MRLPSHPLGSRELKRQRPWLRGTDVRQLQQALKSLGLMEGRVDGIFGYDTAASVGNFQKVFDIKPLETFDETSLEELKPLMAEGINRWSTLQRNFSHTGCSPMPVSLDLKLVWSKNLQDITGITCHRNKLAITYHRGVQAFDFQGQELWKNFDILPRGVATLWGGSMIVPAGDLVFLNLFTGKTEKVLTQGEFTSPVAVKGNTLYAAAKGSVLALDAKGNTLWNYKTSGVLATAPTLAFGFIYFSSYDRNIYCLDDTGMLYWKIKTQDVVQNPLAAWDSLVFAISRDSWLYALNPLTGKALWKKQFSAEEFYMPSFRRGLMLAVDYRGNAYFINPQDGNIKGVVELGVRPTTPPLLCPKTIFIGTEEGLMGISSMTQEPQHYLPGERILSLIPAQLGLFVATEHRLVRLK